MVGLSVVGSSAGGSSVAGAFGAGAFGAGVSGAGSRGAVRPGWTVTGSTGCEEGGDEGGGDGVSGSQQPGIARASSCTVRAIDSSAFVMLYDTAKETIFTFILNRNGSRSNIDDLAQRDRQKEKLFRREFHFKLVYLD